MEYVKFGNAGIEVSRLCLGCMDFPVKLEEKEAGGVLYAAMDEGINFLDTADAYSGGKSEEVVGRLLKGKRDQVVIATKYYHPTYPWRTGRGASRVHIMQAVEDSLRRLQTDYIDLYQMHDPDENTPIEETLSTLDTLVKQGKIRYIGMSNHVGWQMAHMLGVSALHNWEPLVAAQCEYNMLQRSVEMDTAAFCQRFDIAIMVYSPLAGGLLTGKYRRGQEPPEGTRAAANSGIEDLLSDQKVHDVLDELRTMAGRYGVGMNQLAMAWVLSKPFVTTPLIGGSRPEHFEPMWNILDITIEEADLQRIDDLTDIYRAAPLTYGAVSQSVALALNRL